MSPDVAMRTASRPTMSRRRLRNAAYAQCVPVIGKKPAPMLADYPTLIDDGHVHVAVADG